MASTAFTAPCTLGATSLRGERVQNCAARVSTSPRMSVADVYIAEAAVRDGKQAGAPFGEYQPQCTEGASTGAAFSRRVAVLSREFRLRQASASAKYADLYATRREAMCMAGGMHYAEAAAVKFPAAAAAKVLAKREAAMACDRYFQSSGPDSADEYMWKSVKNQYVAALTCPGGVFGTGCADGAAKEQAEDARVNALAVEYGTSMMTVKQRTAAIYASSQMAITTSRGCSYEEEQFINFPKMAGAMTGMRTGAYAASIYGAKNAGAASTGQMGKSMPLALRLADDATNASTLFPGSLIRPAVKKVRKPWETTSIPSYAYMSEAAVEFGVKAQTEGRFDPSKSYSGKWSSGWQPASKSSKSYATV